MWVVSIPHGHGDTAVASVGEMLRDAGGIEAGHLAAVAIPNSTLTTT